MLLYATTTTMQGLENIPYMDCSMSNFFLAVEETSILKAFLLKVIKNCLQNSKHTTKKGNYQGKLCTGKRYVYVSPWAYLKFTSQKRLWHNDLQL